MSSNLSNKLAGSPLEPPEDWWPLDLDQPLGHTLVSVRNSETRINWFWRYAERVRLVWSDQLL